MKTKNIVLLLGLCSSLMSQSAFSDDKLLKPEEPVYEKETVVEYKEVPVVDYKAVPVDKDQVPVWNAADPYSSYYFSAPELKNQDSESIIEGSVASYYNTITDQECDRYREEVRRAYGDPTIPLYYMKGMTSNETRAFQCQLMYEAREEEARLERELEMQVREETERQQQAQMQTQCRTNFDSVVGYVSPTSTAITQCLNDQRSCQIYQNQYRNCQAGFWNGLSSAFGGDPCGTERNNQQVACDRFSHSWQDHGLNTACELNYGNANVCIQYYTYSRQCVGQLTFVATDGMGANLSVPSWFTQQCANEARYNSTLQALMQ